MAGLKGLSGFGGLVPILLTPGVLLVAPFVKDLPLDWCHITGGSGTAKPRYRSPDSALP